MILNTILLHLEVRQLVQHSSRYVSVMVHIKMSSSCKAASGFPLSLYDRK